MPTIITTTHSDRDPLSPCWVHDMAATRCHLIIVEPPLYMDMPSLVTGSPRPYIFMNWRPEVRGGGLRPEGFGGGGGGGGGV